MKKEIKETQKEITKQLELKNRIKKIRNRRV